MITETLKAIAAGGYTFTFGLPMPLAALRFPGSGRRIGVGELTPLHVIHASCEWSNDWESRREQEGKRGNIEWPKED